MDVDEVTPPAEEPLTREEKRAARREKRAAQEEKLKANEAQRVAWDGQRATLQSFAEAGKTAREAYDHLCKAKGSAAMSKQNAYRVFKEFKESGRTDYRGQRGQHESPRGKPRERTEVNIAKIRELIEEDARMTFQALSYESGIGIATVKAIIKQDLGLTKKCARND